MLEVVIQAAQIQLEKENTSWMFMYVHYKKIKKASMVTDLVKKGEISNVHKLQTFQR